MGSTTKPKKEAERSFHEALAEGGETPESLMIKVLRGQDTVQIDSESGGRKTKRITKDMIQAARDLLPYRLPKLNAIDAQVKNVDLTHEQWIEQMDEDD